MPKKKPPDATIPCQYGCGNTAVGALSVSFITFSRNAESYQRDFSIHSPTCRACAKGAITLRVNIPSVNS